MSGWNGQLPEGLTETDLLDLVEGEPLNPAREAAVIGALKSHPEIALVVKRLRADASAARGLPPVKAPAGMIEAIEARLERETLAALAEAEAQTAPIPIASHRVDGPGTVRIFLESVWARRLATAASLAIVGGLGVWASLEVVKIWPKVPERLVSAGDDPVDSAQPAPISTPDPAASTLAAGEPSEDPAALPSPEPALAKAEPEAPAEPVITLAQAADLAEQGRLVVTVRSANATETARRMENLIALSEAEAAWRGWVGDSLTRLPVEYAALTVPSLWPQLEASPALRPNAPAPTTVAGTNDLTPPSVRPAAAPRLNVPRFRPVVRAVYTLRLEPSEGSLSGLLRELASTGKVVVFRELEEPVAEPLPLDAESVLWWTAPPQRWTRRATVPVVVETVE